MNDRFAVRPLLVAAALCTIGGDEAVGGKILQETWENTYAVSEEVSLNVRCADGRIYIYGSERNEMQVTAVKRAFTQERLDALSLRVALEGNRETGGETATIETIIPPAPQGGLTQDRSGTVDWTIIVPQNCRVVKAELSNGEILIEGMRGAAVNATVGKGRLLARNCFSPTNLVVGRGGLDLFYNWWEEEPFTLEAQIEDGDLRVGLPEDASLHLNAVSTSGHIVNHFAEEEERNGSVPDLNTAIGKGAGAEFQLRTGTGNIRIDRME